MMVEYLTLLSVVVVLDIMETLHLTISAPDDTVNGVQAVATANVVNGVSN